MKRRNLFIILALFAILAGAAVLASLYVQAGQQITEFVKERPLPGAALYDQDGKIIKRLGAGNVYVPLDQTPKALQDAIKSSTSNIAINQSLASRILEPQGLWTRLQAALLPSVLERRYSERERLEMYLNHAYFGEGAYGVEAASQTYFAKPAAEIDLAQSALLAALAQEPDASPFSNQARAREKRNAVLVQMAHEGHITSAEQREAQEASIESQRREPGYAHHFSDYLGTILIDELGEERVFQGGLRVTTTLDRDLQKLAENLFAEAELEGGLVALN
nr:hypothetical protein [Bacillota bacterium]